ncbi:MAG: biopolymer transporter ExbD [Gemmatimonadales bacterium]
MGMKVGDSGEGVNSEPNVVPMIDVMLVLLIIFMIVTPVISAGFTAQIPEARNLERAPEEDGDVVLGIDSDGNYYLDPAAGEIAPIPRDSLTSFLTQVYASRTKDRILFFKADATLPYSAVEEALEAAREAGVRVLASITEQRRDDD